jgi:hypothetical protein
MQPIGVAVRWKTAPDMGHMVMLKIARQMLDDWALGSQTRKMDEWLRSKARLPDHRLGVVVALATHQRHALSALFSCDILNPAQVLIDHPMICSKLEGMLAQMHKANQPLAMTGSLPWLFTFQAFLRPSLYERGVDVWRQLQRGIPYVEDCVAEMGDAGRLLNLKGFAEFPKGFRP